MPSPDHVIIHDGTHHEAGTMQCLRCGSLSVIRMPVQIPALVKAADEFTAEHVACPLVEHALADVFSGIKDANIDFVDLLGAGRFDDAAAQMIEIGRLAAQGEDLTELSRLRATMGVTQ